MKFIDAKHLPLNWDDPIEDGGFSDEQQKKWHEIYTQILQFHKVLISENEKILAERKTMYNTATRNDFYKLLELNKKPLPDPTACLDKMISDLNKNPLFNNDTTTKHNNGFFDLSLLETGGDIRSGDYSVNWIWENMFPEGAIILFYAKGGSGKSTLISQLAEAISNSAPFLGLQTSKRPVVILDYENPLGVLKGRMETIDAQEGVFYWTIKNNPPQLNDPEWESLCNLVATLVNPLLIFDTLQSSTANLDITSNKDYSPVMSRIKTLREMGATVVLLHHTPKSDATEYIGPSVIYNQSDHVIAMYPVKKAGTDEEKSTDGDKPPVYRLGSKDKTRYAHHKIFVTFDNKKKFFIKSDGPDQDAIKILQDLIAELAPVNQSTLSMHDSVETLIGKRAAESLLKSFSGTYWNSYKGEKNATIYTPIFSGGETGTLKQAGNTMDTEFTSYPEWAK